MKWFASVALVPLAAVLVWTVTPCFAQGQSDNLKVATRVVKPFVVEEGDKLTGFSIELWEAIAAQMGVRTEFVVKPTVQDLLDATRVGSNETDLAISAISITEERDRSWDFSQPMFDAGLQILVPEQSSGGGLGRILGTLLGAASLPIIVLVVLSVLVAGHLVWIFERANPKSWLEDRGYFPGIFEATFWAVSTLATQAESMPKSAAARVVAVVWMFSAVVFVAVFTASVTSSLTVQQLKTDIQGPDDLPGKQVATVKGSTAAQYLTGRSIHPTEFNSIDDATDSLLKGEVDAVVYDAPVLLYFSSHDGKGKADVVGSIFRKESYGILFPNGSPLRKTVNEALLRLKENGTYDIIYTKWFGAPGSNKGS